MKKIDKKILQLRNLTNEFIFIEYYPHEHGDCYKIYNEFTKYRNEKIVLCKVKEGVNKAIDLAIEVVKKWKDKK